MPAPTAADNPFPGLRPFGPDETHLFFGREEIVDQLLGRLRKNRFLCIIGSSGCGKSSLVRAGLVPSLYSGFMTAAGSSWRVAIMRPGNDPVGNLADALNAPDILGDQASVKETSPVLTEITLRRSNLGLVECVRLARLPPADNLLIVVDQFEELFRFKHSGRGNGARDEAIAFVKRLLAAVEQSVVPIYVVLTLRSEFTGECNEYPGLPEAINSGQFLVPRMTREQLRSAITGPVAVAGGEISPRLVVRLLNDIGDNPDRLPMLQHALLRTWNCWCHFEDTDGPIDIGHYEKVGTMAHALSSHADEAYEELGTDRAKGIAVRLFKALTDRTGDSHGVRRPTSMAQLCLLADADLSEVAQVIEVFRKPERSFLMPPAPTRLGPETVVDISHESLMRVWDRLRVWTRQESESAQVYLRLARAAARYADGTTGLWRDPELALALNWRRRAAPTKAWAERYDSGFDQAMGFLDASKEERDRRIAEERRARRQKLQVAWGVSVALLVFALIAFFQQQRAERESARAEQNFQLAVQAVDEMLTDVAVEESLADVPQTEQLRQQLLEKARLFFETLQDDEAAAADLRLRTASAQVRLGKIYRLQGMRAEAEAAHREAIQHLGELHREYGDDPEIQLVLSLAHNELGEQLRPYDSAGAEAAYDEALRLQRDLVGRFPDESGYRHELGRTYGNRGILIGKAVDRSSEAEASFMRAIEVFADLRQRRDDSADAFRLAGVQNNLAILYREIDRDAEAVGAYGDAIRIIEDLVSANPEKREYREDLAMMYNNLSNLHLTMSNPELALEANSRALRLFEGLATPVQALRNEIANSRNTRGRILIGLGRRTEAAEAYEIALDEFAQLERDFEGYGSDPGLDLRIGNAHANLAILLAAEERFDDAVVQVSRAIEYYERAVAAPGAGSGFSNSLANAYWLLADLSIKSGAPTQAIAASEEFAELGVAADGGTDYRAALLYARATKLLAADETLSPTERREQTEAAEQRTVELLRSALTKGYSTESFSNAIASGFSHLQDRPDFRQLLEITGKTR